MSMPNISYIHRQDIVKFWIWMYTAGVTKND